jgi:hypothetical protein
LEGQKYKKDMSIVKIIFMESQGDKRRHERSKIICADDVENNLQYAHWARRWTLKRSVREELAAKVSKVQVLQEPYLPWSEGLKYVVSEVA